MNWPTVPLGEITKIVGGSTPRRDDPKNWGAGHYWVTPTDLPMPGDGVLDLKKTKETITDAGLGACSTSLLPIGTVLFSTRATIGKLAISNVPVATNQGFNNLIPGPSVYNRFLAYALQYFTPEITQLAGSTTFKEVSRSALRAYRVPIPALTEQHRIVELLDEADRLRKLRREADTKAARILPALFLKMFGDPAANPMGWDEHPLRSVIASVEAGWSSVSEARQRRNDEFGVLKVSAVTGGRFLPEEHKAVPEMPESRALVTPRRGDLLFSRANTRALVAASCIVEKDEPKLFLSDKLWRITTKDTVASTLYLKGLFWKDGVRDQFRASSSGSSGSMLNISQEAVLRTVVPVPPYLLQQKFERSAWETMALKQTTREAGDQLDAIWQILLTRAFSGQLTAQWRKAHMKELLVEMEQQAHLLNLPLPNALEAQT